MIFDFINVIQNECTLNQVLFFLKYICLPFRLVDFVNDHAFPFGEKALIKDKRHPNLSLLAASQTKDKGNLMRCSFLLFVYLSLSKNR